MVMNEDIETIESNMDSDFGDDFDLEDLDD